MKNIVVQKFGGTSLGSIERIKAVANTIKKTSLNEFPIIVVSAMSGETDKLINLAKGISDAPAERELDALLSTGEKVSAALLAMTLQSLGLQAKSFSAAQISMRTTSNHSKENIIDINIDTIQCQYLYQLSLLLNDLMLYALIFEQQKRILLLIQVIAKSLPIKQH